MTMDGRKRRILFNAEAFGFGPTAAVATLAQRFGDLDRHGYAGTGHSLDLQRPIPYGRIHDLTGADRCAWRNTISEYDVVVTAMDTETARIALSLGKLVVFYDALTWYWKDEPRGDWERVREIITHPRTLYIAQDFFGVRDRLASISSKNWRIVPPVLSLIQPASRPEALPLVLVNLGGLKNPYIDDGILADFASTLVSALMAAIPSHFRLEVTASEGIAAAVKACPTQTCSPSQVRRLLATCAYAICTPGLGNIYEAAACGKRVLWLLPANDSQGLQLTQLRARGMIDASVDWEALNEKIDYTGNQEACLRDIGGAMRRLTARQPTLVSTIRRALHDLNAEASPKLPKLMDTFGGKDGADLVVAEIRKWIAFR